MVASQQRAHAAQVVQHYLDRDLSAEEKRSAEMVVDLDAEQTTCPACQTDFSPTEARCPECGLNFGG